ncbi:MAG: S9 family peptidase [Acidimicrobiales bacterium]|nr:S9 family peptidase [Acidimicrobiales bacterium]
MSDPTESFPRRSARSQRFTLGEPRNVAVAADGSRVVFARSTAGDDPVNALWVLDVAAGEERLAADPRALLADPGDERLPPAERARRERAREGAGGVVAFAVDPKATVAAFALGGRLFVADLVTGGARGVAVTGPVFDPRPDPTGRLVAYVAGPSLRVVDLGPGGGDREVAGEAGPGATTVSWGSAEFVAAEEMGRARGFWWAPDGERLAVARVDVAPVGVWHVADAADPAAEPAVLRYPAAGTADADVALWVVGLDGGRAEVAWDRAAFPYLVEVSWGPAGPLTVVVQARDQRRMQVLRADPDTGVTDVIRDDADPAWLDIVPGVPGRLADGRLVWTVDRDDTRRLVLGDEAVTPAGLQVRSVLHVGDDHVLVAATDDPTQQRVCRVGADGSLVVLTDEPGVHTAVAGGDVVVVRSASLAWDGVRSVVWQGGRRVAELASAAWSPGEAPRVELLELGERRLRAALVLPRGRDLDADDPLPVLLDPYGGPHAARVVRTRAAFHACQWLADQGFAVLVVDGRGTPGRGPAWERAVAFDLAGPVLDDQVDALHALAAARPGLDLTRVGIRGWSFGGYLAALAVLRRPDVFRAAVAGAPVTEWRLYDTHYTERYLGHPAEHAEAYERTSLLPLAAGLERPLLLVHGLADDNVVAAHTLRLSRALLEAGRPHTVLPLSGVTHMTPQEQVAENLLLLQVAFLKDALGVG